MANFDTSYRLLLPREGGYSNRKSDYGKETYQGISRRYWPNWKGWAIIDAIKAARGIDQDEIIHDYNLKLLVKEFYRKNFWDTMQGNSIKTQGIADVLFDSHVLMGGNGIEVAQRVLRSFGFNIAVDGVVGRQQTLPALNNVNQDAFYKKFLEARAAYHRTVAANDPSQLDNLTGWLNRVASFPALDLKKVLA